MDKMYRAFEFCIRGLVDEDFTTLKERARLADYMAVQQLRMLVETKLTLLAQRVREYEGDTRLKAEYAVLRLTNISLSLWGMQDSYSLSEGNPRQRELMKKVISMTLGSLADLILYIVRQYKLNSTDLLEMETFELFEHENRNIRKR